MIIMFKKDEVNGLLDKLRDIEEKFWMNYKFYNESNKHFIELRFNELYKELEKHLDTVGIQEELDLNE